MKSIGFIGAGGNMAGAIIDSILSNKLDFSLNFYEPLTEKVEKYENSGNICGSLSELVDSSDMIFFCVKPQVIFSVLDEIKKFNIIDKCFVSIAAGITIDSIKNVLGENARVIRVMPNTPLLVSEGAAGICKKAPVSDNEYETVFKIFNLAGIAVEIDNEELMDAVTAVSGSGPAYVYRFMKNMVEQGIELGLSSDNAFDLALQTIIGSAKMMKSCNKTTEDLQILIDKVTSPNGTTYAALKTMDATGFDNSLKQALSACEKRSKELSKGK